MSRFAHSALLLQVLIWTQVLVATDAVLKQTMIANGREYAVVARALIGLACLAALVLGLGYSFGLVGAAAGVLVAAAITLSLDTVFVSRQVLDLDVPRFLLKPLGCAFLAAAALLLLDGASPFLRLAAGTRNLRHCCSRDAPRAEGRTRVSPGGREARCRQATAVACAGERLSMATPVAAPAQVEFATS